MPHESDRRHEGRGTEDKGTRLVLEPVSFPASELLLRFGRCASMAYRYLARLVQHQVRGYRRCRNSVPTRLRPRTRLVSSSASTSIVAARAATRRHRLT